MAINKKLIHFKNKENFDTEVANNNILDNSIVFIQDSKEISTHGTVYKTVNWSVLKPKEALVGDVCLYDKNADKLIIVSTSEDLSNYSSDSYSPVGIVVIPSSHDVYGDGSCGVMSIKAMNCSTPTTGKTSEQNMYWGVYGTDISTMSNLNVVPSLGTMPLGTPADTLQGTKNYGYMPTDKGNYNNPSGASCPHDTNATYHNSTSSYYCFIPSPYLTDGSRNPAYYQTSDPSSTANALADFDGVGNTQKIIAQRGTKDYSSWLPTYNTEADYPAASCCDMFYTDGTKQGDWYLPACGELGYMISRFNTICASFIAIRSAYGDSVGAQLVINRYYWSSSEYSNNNARYISTGDGKVYCYSKGSNGYVRAWLRVKP